MAGMRHPLFTFVLALLGRLAPAIAGVRVLEAATWRDAMRWLRDAEALLRRALFAQAVILAAGMQAPKAAVRPLPESTPRTGGLPNKSTFAIGLGARTRRRVAPETPREPSRPQRFLAGPLAARIALMRAAVEHAAWHARRLARRIARRRHDLPLMLRKVARHRPHAALAETLGPVFREPPEILISETRRLASGLDPPAHLRLAAETIPPFRPEEETMAHAPTHLSRENAGESREVALGPDQPFPLRRRSAS